MAIGSTITTVFSGSNKVGASTWSPTTTADVPLDNFLFVAIARDNSYTLEGNSNTVTSVTVGGLTLSKLIEYNRGGSFAATATVAVFGAKVKTTITSGANIDIVFSGGVTAKTAIAGYFSFDTSRGLGLIAAGSSSSSTPTFPTLGAAPGAALFVGATAMEAATTAITTASAGTVLANAYTTGSTSVTNMAGGVLYAYSSDGTEAALTRSAGATGDNATVKLAFYEHGPTWTAPVSGSASTAGNATAYRTDTAAANTDFGQNYAVIDFKNGSYTLAGNPVAVTDLLANDDEYYYYNFDAGLITPGSGYVIDSNGSGFKIASPTLKGMMEKGYSIAIEYTMQSGGELKNDACDDFNYPLNYLATTIDGTNNKVYHDFVNGSETANLPAPTVGATSRLAYSTNKNFFGAALNYNNFYDSAAAASSVTDNIIVSTTGQMATNYASIANNFTSRRSDWTSPEGDVTNIRCVDYMYYFDSTGIHVPNNYTIKRYLEYPAGVFHQVKWSGASTRSFSTSANSHTSDVIISSVTGLPLEIPAGTKFWWRTVNVTGSTVTKFPVIVRPAGCSTLGLDDGNSTSDLGNSGTIGATSSTNTFGPMGVIGTVKAPNARAFLLLGDSLVFGVGDVASTGPNGSSGWLARGLDGHYSMCKIAVGGMTASEFVGMANSVSFQPVLAQLGFTDAICEAGINDLSQNSATNAAILSDQQTLYTALATYNLFGSARLWQTTMTARTTSTDSWASAVNQTPKTDGTYGNVNALNATLRTLPAQLYGILDAADFDMTARNSVIHAGPYPCSTDGTHFNSAKAADMATLVYDALAVPTSAFDAFVTHNVWRGFSVTISKIEIYEPQTDITAVRAMSTLGPLEYIFMTSGGAGLGGAAALTYDEARRVAMRQVHWLR